ISLLPTSDEPVTTTRALGTTAPEGSLTVPCKPPVVSCASADSEKNAQNMSTKMPTGHLFLNMLELLSTLANSRSKSWRANRNEETAASGASPPPSPNTEQILS